MRIKRIRRGLTDVPVAKPVQRSITPSSAPPTSATSAKPRPPRAATHGRANSGSTPHTFSIGSGWLLAGAISFAVLAVIIVIGLRGSDATTAKSGPADGSAQTIRVSTEDPVAPTQNSIRSDLEKLSVVEESPFGYDRSLFIHWVDDDGDGCDTRDEVLIAESEIQVEVGVGCKVSAGRWFSLYDGLVIESMGELDIDHMVPLKEAWDSGASSWTETRRREYANDLVSSNSLRAVTAASNRSKSDKDPGQWLPSNEAHICKYLSDWISVKEKWELSVDPDEYSAILGAVSRNCKN